MEDIEKEVKEKLKNYVNQDIVFLKKEWKKWAEEGKWDLFKEKTGANVQVIYNILNPKKIKRIRKAKYYENRYDIRLNHSLKYEIKVVVVFDQPKKGNLGIVSFYKLAITN